MHRLQDDYSTFYEKLILRKMTEFDLDAVHNIDKVSFGEGGWSRNVFENDLKNQHSYNIVLTYNGQVIGYICSWFIVDSAHVTSFAVDPNFRGLKLGEYLLRYIINHANSLDFNNVTLEVRVSNVTAQNLYEKLGFLKDGYRAKYYPDNLEDAIIMTLFF